MAKRTDRTLALAPWVFTIGFFLLWEFACRVLGVSPFVLPAPSSVLAAIWEYRTQLTYHGFHTLWMTLAGFGLAVFWFGVGWLPPVLTAFLISFFPIVVNVATGISTIEPETEDVLRALGASKTDIIMKVGVPRAMPYFFGSLKVAITLAYVGSVIGEQNASNVGIGNLLTRASAAFEVPLVWAALVVLAVMGVVMYTMTVMVERSMTGWAQRSQMAAA
jgi:NitT/TauT family transport system permease protein